MRLLVIGLDGSLLDPHARAAERQRAYFAGWDVTIVLLGTGERAEVMLGERLRVVRPGGATRVAAFFRARRELAQLLRDGYWDAVSAQDPLWCGMLGYWAARRGKTTFHLQDHSGLFARAPFGRVERVLRPVSRWLARQAQRIRTVSARGARGLAALRIGSDRIDTVPILEDLTPFFSAVPRPVSGRMVCVARLEPEKGVDGLLRAFAQVKKQVADATLEIIGDGSARPGLERLAGESQVADAIVWRGRSTSVEQLAQALERASCYVQPSRFEGWGMAVLEAAAAGVPVVMTDVGCAGEVILDRVHGRVVPPGNVSALANALVQMLQLPAEERLQIGARARDAARAFVARHPGVAGVREAFARAAEPRPTRLLVVCQAVDEADPLFGFFVHWLAEAAKQGIGLTVLALRVGAHHLPASVQVIPLRPKGSRSRIAVIKTLLQMSWTHRAIYDGVFVRGDAQYLVFAGWLWRLLQKRLVFWYTHYAAPSPWFWLGSIWPHAHVTAVRASNPLRRAIVIGHHIDATRFSGTRPQGKKPVSVLIFGRVSPVKRVPWMVALLRPFVERGEVTVRIVGASSDAGTTAAVHEALIPGMTWEAHAMAERETPALYANADIVLNATPGSLDKTIIEAAASGCVVCATTPGFAEGLPDGLRWLQGTTEQEIQEAIQRLVRMRPEERQQIGDALAVWARETHGLAQQIRRLRSIFSSL